MGNSRGVGLTTRLFVAFLAIAAVGVAVVSVAALVGSARGVDSVEVAARQAVADRCALLAGAAYADAGGWRSADLTAAQDVAAAANAGLVVRGRGAGQGRGMDERAMSGPAGPASGSVTSPVTVDGEVVGEVVLVFGTSGSQGAGRDIAWTWILLAAVAAVAVAALAAWLVSRRISRPLVGLAHSVRAFGSGDRSARADVRGAGEIADLAQAFDDMADRVQRSEQARRAIAADVAHEVRTPLTALQAGLEEMRDGLVDPDAERLAGLHDQVLRLGRVVDDLGRLAAAEDPTVDVAEMAVDLATQARRSVEAARPLCDAAGVDLRVDVVREVSVLGDPDRIAQILGNLLSNVARYCRPGDSAVVRVDVEGGYGVLAVADTGPGMSPHDVAHAFDRFHRGETAVGITGSGLGLSVVRALVRAQGGQVDLVSTPGEGTTVTVRLPLR